MTFYGIFIPLTLCYLNVRRQFCDTILSVIIFLRFLCSPFRFHLARQCAKIATEMRKQIRQSQPNHFLAPFESPECQFPRVTSPRPLTRRRPTTIELSSLVSGCRAFVVFYHHCRLYTGRSSCNPICVQHPIHHSSPSPQPPSLANANRRKYRIEKQNGFPDRSIANSFSNQRKPALCSVLCTWNSNPATPKLHAQVPTTMKKKTNLEVKPHSPCLRLS